MTAAAPSTRSAGTTAAVGAATAATPPTDAPPAHRHRGAAPLTALPAAMTASLVLLAVAAPWAPALVPLLMAPPAVLWALDALDTHRLRAPMLLAVVALVPATQAVSTVTAIDPGRSAVLLALSVLGWGCAAAVVRSGPTSGPLVLGALLVSLVLASASSLTGLGDLTSHAGGSVVDGRLQGPFAQPNELGAFAVLLLPVLLAATVEVRHHVLRALMWSAAVPVLLALALSLSRGSWVGTAAALATLVVLVPRLRPVAALAATTVVAGVLVGALLAPTGPVGVLLARVGSLSDPGRSPDDDRPLIWSFVLRVAGEHPLTGVGPGGLETAATRASSPMAGEPPLHGHDLALTVLVETGALGLAALVLMTAVGAVVLGRALLGDVDAAVAVVDDPVDRPPGRPPWPRHGVGPGSGTLRWTTSGPLAALVGAGVHGIIDMPWRNPILTATAWLLVGALAASPLARRLRTHPAGRAADPVTTARPSTPTDQDILMTQTTQHRTDTMRTPVPATPMPATSSARPTDRSPRRPWLLPAVLAVLATAALVAGLLVLPSQREATAVVGLRSEATAEGRVPTGSDELRLIAQQYAVALSAETTVDDAVAGLGLGGDASAEAAVDPDTTTVRISARADGAADASRLATRLVDDAQRRADDDPQVQLVVLSDASAEHTDATPSKPLYLAAGLSVVVVAGLGLWLFRRRQ